MDLLRSGSGVTEKSVGQVVEALGMTQPTVSKHLKVLRDAGVVLVREDGQHRYYRCDESALTGARQWLGGSKRMPHTAATPYVDLGEAGRAVGSLAKDVMTWLDDVVARVRR